MTEEYYLYTFESTHGAIATEKLLKPLGCTIMPVPRHISTSCGISVRVTVDKFDISKETFLGNTDLLPDEYHVYHITNDKSDKGLGFKFEQIQL
ncbi:DUF3343 domain-containing protein [Mogibacterium pumilum]|uniref:Putative Se/S carrier protein-like domain-containing protein n=1 Tax=Mogibacterium pumilum TaxID=86332 RepID=A0A223AR59_9FIRM|nr:DUF3343 domain-containing protein [Mogibacterium pumilum]ASS37437.1 hypothetical protein AXF17_02460 [Mogibacterium pumilum]